MPGTARLGRAEIEDRSEFARLLQARVPPAWPPPLNDAETMAYAVRFLEANPAVGWGVWYFVLLAQVTEERVAIGIGGFKGQPAPDGSVELGYSILEDFQGKGYATEAVGGMVSWAFAHPQVRIVTAQTLPELTGSIRVLEKSRFSFAGPGSEQGAICFELTGDTYRILAGSWPGG